MPPLHKVTVFITRTAPSGQLLALFQHPYAGIQIPAGTVDPGEMPEAAAFREAAEETGLADLTLLRSLGSRNEVLPANQRVVFERTTVYARPDLGSFDWAILPRGATVNLARETTRPGGSFSHVTYLEYDNLDDPRYVTYQITGWVPSQRLTDRRVRHFFHFEYHGAQSEPWWVETDNHRFRLFWAPLDALPEIVAPQRPWLEMLHP
jgi:8-oxo-dGTP pyrophosphatase MutT (NUDIX family)